MYLRYAIRLINTSMLIEWFSIWTCFSWTVKRITICLLTMGIIACLQERYNTIGNRPIPAKIQRSYRSSLIWAVSKPLLQQSNRIHEACWKSRLEMETNYEIWRMSTSTTEEILVVSLYGRGSSVNSAEGVDDRRWHQTGDVQSELVYLLLVTRISLLDQPQTGLLVLHHLAGQRAGTTLQRHWTTPRATWRRPNRRTYLPISDE